MSIEVETMKEKNDNPLGLKEKMYTLEEFGSAVRYKIGAENDISDFMLAKIYLTKYPTYSCKIKKSDNYVAQKSCGCC